jgi:hypothetical protein
MDTVFLICAVLGGTVLVCQFAMTLMGMGDSHGDFGSGHDFGGGADAHDFGGHDAGHHGGTEHGHADHGGKDFSTWLFGVITFRTVVAALTFFGLAGKAALSSGMEPVPTMLIALGSGAAALYVVHFLMQSLHRLRSDGTVQIERSVGEPGTVYLTIPGAGAGLGKIHINLQNRLVELQASTAKDRLPTGAKVVVTRVIGPDTVEVEPLAEAIPHKEPHAVASTRH